jgi:hypothetical protein
MRNTLGLLVLGALVAVPLVSVLDAQDSPASPHAQMPSASQIWNFHFEGKRKRGDVIELLQLDDPKYGGPPLSAGFLDSTSEWIVVNYDSNTGIVFAPATRPSLELTFGSGDLEIWAEGYWAQP